MDGGVNNDCNLKSTQNGEDDADTNLSNADDKDLNHNDYNALEDSTAHDVESDDNEEVPYLVVKGFLTLLEI